MVAMIVVVSAYSQSYEARLKQCIQNFQTGIAEFKKENAEEEIQRRYRVLNDCMRGSKFPAFELTQHDGSKFSSKQLAGKVVIISFWFTKSPTAVAAIPMLNELVTEYKDQDFMIVSFAADGFAHLQHFLKEHPVDYRIFEKSRALINNQFSTVLGYPTNIVLNKKGEVVDYRVGASTQPEELAKLKADIKRIIDEELAR